MLRTFDALMREGSVSRAAARLFVGQPAVSASLKRLRDTFGDPLFTRTAHGVTPTARAVALAPRVQAVLSELQLLVSRDEPFDPAGSDRIVRLSGSDNSSRELLPALCRLLAESGSRMRLSWELPDYDRLPERLRKGDVDLGLLPRSAPPVGVESTLLYEDDYVVVRRRAHGSGAAANLEDFCARPHATLWQSRPTLDDAVDQILARHGRSRLVQAAVTTFSQMAALLAESDLQAVFPNRVARKYAAMLEATPLPFALPSYRLFLCWDARSNADPAVAWLRDEVVRLSRDGEGARA
jgi:DNA-binding transcriptional LysR family regulator